MPIVPDDESKPETPGYQPGEFGRRVDALLVGTRKAAQDVPPERAARLLKLRAQTGVDHEILEANLDEAEKIAAEPGFDAIKFRRSHPRLAEWYLKSPNHVAVAKADEESLKRLDLLFYRREDPARPLTEEEIVAQARRAAKRRASVALPKSGFFAEQELPPDPEFLGERVRGKTWEDLFFEEELAQRRTEEEFVRGEEQVGMWGTVKRIFSENPVFL